MSNLQFNRIRICSEREQAGLTLAFSPRRTLLWGGNGAAKSTIIKSIYRAFDAEPQGELPDWDYSAVIAVDFSVEGQEFTAVRKDELRALFRGRELLGVASSSSAWNELFAKVARFDLMLLDRGGVFRRAAPSNYFLPFFINQDGSFGPSWETFKSLKQFQQSVEHTLEYFVRVRPSRYFELKAALQLEKLKQDHMKVELATLQRTRIRLKRNQKAPRFKLSAQQFQGEIQQLTQTANELSKKQDVLRKNIVEHQELASALQEQIRLSNAALKEHSADFKFAGEEQAQGERFVCPTCHAEHDASFHTLLGLAEDARQLLDLRRMLEVDLQGVNSRLERHRRDAAGLRQHYGEIEQVLQSKKGRFSFEDFVKSYSANEADAHLAAEQATVEAAIAASNLLTSRLKVDLAVLSAEHDPKAPLAAFRSAFGEATVALNVPHPETLEQWKLAKRPVESGSRNARSLVAYYSALWKSMAVDGAVPAPIVIDSPNQGAQDRKNLQRLLAVVAASAPSNAQVILAHEEETADFKADLVHSLDPERRLLTTEGFKEVANELFYLVDTARMSLAGVEAYTDDLEKFDEIEGE